MNDLYGIFKKNSSDNHYVSFAKSLNSAYTSKYTRESMKSIENYCSHGANILINNGVCYVSCIRNTAENNDDELSPTLELLLVTFSLERALCDDFDPDTEIKRIIIGRMGDELLGERFWILKAISEMAKVNGALDMKIEIKEIDFKLKPIKLEDRVDHIRKVMPEFEYMQKIFDMDVE